MQTQMTGVSGRRNACNDAQASYTDYQSIEARVGSPNEDGHDEEAENVANEEPLSEGEGNADPKKKDKKLVFLSRSVLKCVRENPMTTGTEIANEILELYKQLCDRVEFKNVQRRVYDALNVLSAMKIIWKHKNNIVYNEENVFIDDEVEPSTVPVKGAGSIKSQN